MRESRCLHQVARISGTPEKTLTEKLEEITNILPQAFPHPGEIWVRIVNGIQEFKTPDYRATNRLIKVDIKVRQEKTGAIEIGSTGPSPALASSLINKQDILLIETVAERLGSIIEHSQAQEALKDSEEKYSKAFRLSPAGIIITDMESGRIIEVNDVFLRFAGYSHKEALRQTTMDIGIWKKKKERDEFIRLLKKPGGARNIEKAVSLKNGREYTVLISADIISLGNRPHVITIVQDITEQKQAREFQESIFSASPMAVYIMREGVIVYTNRQFRKLTGRSQKELTGLGFEDIIPAEDRVFIRAGIGRFQNKKSVPTEFRIINKKGNIRWVMQAAAPIHYKNHPATLGAIVDINDRKQLERKISEYEELDKLKGDILATVSHELRTPLAAIKGYTTMMLDYRKKLKADEAMGYLISIDNSTDRLIKLVDNLMDSSRLDSGMLEMHRTPASLAAVIKSTVKTMGRRINSHKIRVVLPSYLPRVEIDKKRISQVLENLIDNAAYHSPGEKEIVVKAKKKKHEIAVSVTGYGTTVPAKELTAIFERMYKIETGKYRGADGVGLGLYICRRLVEAHSGTIWAESSKNKGTTITFTVPLAGRGNHQKEHSGQN